MNTIEKAVSRFLCWKLPKDFNPDCGISFTRESAYKHPEFGRTLYEPIGTNLLTAEQAKAMLEHVCDPLLTALQEHASEIEQLKGKETEWVAAYQAEYQEATRAFVHVFQLDTKLIAQRKVLEQALEAFTETISMYLEWHKDFPEHVGDKEKPVVQLALAAITAIQEQLK